MKQKKLPVQLLLLPEVKQLFKELALERQMTLAGWLVQAGLSYARSAKRSAPKNTSSDYWPSGWKKSERCMVCHAKTFHDPMEFHQDVFAGSYDEEDKKLGKVRS